MRAAISFRRTTVVARTRPVFSDVVLAAESFQGFATARADCDISQQAYLNDSSRSAITTTRIAHTGFTTFPFYAVTHVAEGLSCDSVRLWGRCKCDDGINIPGCDVSGPTASLESRHPASQLLEPPTESHLARVPPACVARGTC